MADADPSSSLGQFCSIGVGFFMKPFRVWPEVPEPLPGKAWLRKALPSSFLPSKAKRLPQSRASANALAQENHVNCGFY